MMNDVQQRAAAKKFADNWKGKGYEKGESQKFWLQLLGEVLGVEHPAQFINFELQVQLAHTSFIDAYISETKVMIEQKSLGKDLLAPIKQSDGTWLKPIDQAKRYVSELPKYMHPDYIVTCNFEKFLVYDMNRPQDEPNEILLENLPEEFYRLKFLVNNGAAHLEKEKQVSIAAGELVGKLYDAFLAEYRDRTSEEALRSLNKLCVRLVFCLYAEDAGIFGEKDMFHDYLAAFPARHMRGALIDLFRVLNQKEDERDPYLDEELAAFPYVNGGLFADDDIEIPQFTDAIRELILEKASYDFNWSEISPTIFGAVFESTLNPETRRSGGMHYTSIENIHKVIDPLFLDELRDEFTKIKNNPVKRTRKRQLEIFQKKLSELKFLDPACGSGNFLTETYICLRKLENEALRLLSGGEIVLGELLDPVQVHIEQFYGIEINDFAVSVAKTALWIAESQMLKETEDIVQKVIDFLPLGTYTNIHEGNALRMDWAEVVSPNELNYIMGNPPFVANSGRVSASEDHSKKMLSTEQADDRLFLFGKNGGLLDYVACWYKKSADMMKGTTIRTAFVSTDSITQGQQVEPLWKPLFEQGIKINFAHKSFKWINEAPGKIALVYVVIVGFSYMEGKNLLFDKDSVKIANNINAYLLDADNIIVHTRRKPICDVPEMMSGGKPVEGGYFIFDDKEKEEFVKEEPLSEKYFRRFTSGESYINNKMKWCLWLLDISPRELQSMPKVKERVRLVKEFRLNSKKVATRKLADCPTNFAEIKQPDTDYLLIPLTTSRNRKYIPIGFVSKNIIANNGASFIASVTNYHFGILTSNVHMAWMKAVCGYFGPSYRYSNTIVYNNFPWPNPTPAQKAKIEKTAQAILDARAQHPESSLADLYGEFMPNELLNAHRANDRAVMEAYGFRGKADDESVFVAELMKMYEQMAGKENKK